MVQPGPDESAAAPAAPRFGEALAFWARLGCISFGGPAGQIALMHEELVVRRRWISEGRFQHALNYCMLLPGPEAQQLATYLGWLMHRTAGGLAAGALFVLPSLVLLVALSWLYVAHGQQPALAGLFYGIKPAVTVLVAHAAWRLGRRTLRAPWAWAVALAAFVALQGLALPFPWIVLGGAVAGAVAARWWPGDLGGVAAPGAAQPRTARPPAVIDDNTPTPAHARWQPRRLALVVAVGLGLWGAALGLLAATQGWQTPLAQMGWFFTKAALLTFGGAYAVLPYVAQGAVVEHGWLSAAQMIDGLALGETTPGPLIMVVAFVGFIGAWQAAVAGQAALALSGMLGALVATFFTFLPSFVFILAGAPLVEATHGRRAFTAPLAGISAAVVGVIVSLAFYFAGHVLWPQGAAGPFEWPALAIGAVAALALWRFQAGVITVILGCALAGLAWRLVAA